MHACVCACTRAGECLCVSSPYLVDMMSAVTLHPLQVVAVVSVALLSTKRSTAPHPLSRSMETAQEVCVPVGGSGTADVCTHRCGGSDAGLSGMVGLLQSHPV